MAYWHGSLSDGSRNVGGGRRKGGKTIDSHGLRCTEADRMLFSRAGQRRVGWHRRSNATDDVAGVSGCDLPLDGPWGPPGGYVRRNFRAGVGGSWT